MSDLVTVLTVLSRSAGWLKYHRTTSISDEASVLFQLPQKSWKVLWAARPEALINHRF